MARLAVSSFVMLLLGSLALDMNALSKVDKNRPVSKVLTLLKDMVNTLEKEAKEDEDTYEAMGCWCETGRTEKEKAIKDNGELIGTLNADIESYTASSSRLNTEIAKLSKEVAENEEALEKATAMRKKELAEFTVEEKETLTSIGQMKGAVEALSKHHDSSFLQSSSSLKALVGFRKVLSAHSDLVSQVTSQHQRELLDSFLQMQSKHNPAHAPASGQIFGVIKGMQEGFEGNLEKSQAEETQSQTDFESLKKAKDEEIAAGKALLDTKSVELATTDEKNAQAAQDLKDTENTLDADTEYLKNLKEQCKNVDAEYAERKKTRTLEIKATSEALAYLNSDDAQDLYSRTFSFVQMQAQSHKRSSAANALSLVAAKTHDPRLSLLANRMRSPQAAFKEVRASIQTMMDELTVEQEEEVKKKDFCVDAIQANEAETDDKTRFKQSAEATIEDLTMTIKKLTQEIAALKQAIKDLQVQYKRAAEDREKENSDFQTTVADQRATAKLLTGALDILKGFYEKNALMQASAHNGSTKPAGAPPPPGFKKMEKNSQSGGVMGMIQQIINDAEAMEADAVKAEEESQTAYETFVKDSNVSLDTMSKDIVNKTEDKGKAEVEKAQKEADLKTVVEEISELKGALADLHADCDFTLNNFDARQTARGNEIQALREAISIFSGR